MKTTKRSALMNLIADAIITKPAMVNEALAQTGFAVKADASQKELAKATVTALNKSPKFAAKLSSAMKPGAPNNEMVQAMGLTFGGLKPKTVSADGMFADRLRGSDTGGTTGAGAGIDNGNPWATEEQKMAATDPAGYQKYLEQKAAADLANQIAADKTAKELQDLIDFQNGVTNSPTGSTISNGAKMGIVAAMVVLTVVVVVYAAK